MMQRQGQLGADGTPARRERQAVANKPVAKEKTSPRQFVGEVRSELNKVAWPTRPEVINYTIVVIITMIIVTLLTFVFDYVFARGVLFLLER